MDPTRRALLFSFGEKYLVLVLGLASTMVLARLLTPAEIGVYSVAAVLAGLAQVVRDFGVGQYVIQERELDTAKLRAALFTSMAVAWTLAALVLALGAPLGRFYHEPRLQTVLELLSLNFVLIPFSSVTLPYLRRQLRFAAIFQINAAHGVAQLACAVGLALHGFGSLSMAWAALAGTVATIVSSFFFRPGSLPWLPSRRGVRAVLAFGLFSTGAGVIDEAGVAAPDLIVGKVIGVAEVAMLGKAMSLLGIFNQLITSAVSPVLFPLYAARSRDGGDFRQAYLTTVCYMSALSWPFFGFLALTAPSLLRLLYGPQWDAAVPLIRIMCISSAFYSMFSMSRYLFVAIGQVRAQARLDALAVLLRVAAILLAAPLGLHWVAWAVVLGALFRSYLCYRLLSRLAGIRIRALLAAVGRSAMLALLCLSAPAVLCYCLDDDATPSLAVLAGAALASAVLWLLGVVVCRHAVGTEFALLWQKFRGDKALAGENRAG